MSEFFSFLWSALVNGQEAAKERKNSLLVGKVGALVYYTSTLLLGWSEVTHSTQ